jgi:hypothetical protein
MQPQADAERDAATLARAKETFMAVKRPVVVIDGVRYVPATGATPRTKDVLDVLQRQFWGDADVPHDGWRDLRIVVTDDDRHSDGETFDQFAARLAERISDQ